ncbi:MAG: thiamine pyrophosphate-dependent enzyme, partial [Corynebacterium flavescens]|nr:thiamine pyrophosphate-dependent enzyme [Corynebacterium flavescens]
PAIKVDGTDFFAVYEAAQEAVERGRRGEGPTAIEAKAYRWFGHFEGDPGLYRTPEQLKAVREENDPLLIFRQKVGRKVSAKELDAIEAEVKQQVEDAVEFAKNSPWPKPEELTTDVYASY